MRPTWTTNFLWQNYISFTVLKPHDKSIKANCNELLFACQLEGSGSDLVRQCQFLFDNHTERLRGYYLSQPNPPISQEEPIQDLHRERGYRAEASWDISISFFDDFNNNCFFPCRN